jgi:hypothetical protein
MTPDVIVHELEKIYKDENWGIHNIEIIEQCVVSYKKMSMEDRYLIRLLLAENVCWGLIMYGVEMASICLNTPNQEAFTNGLYAFGMVKGTEELTTNKIWKTFRGQLSK